MRIRLFAGVALGVAAGLLANKFIPTDGIWPHLIIGLAVGIGFFILVQLIRNKGNLVP